ncbi:750_t:CDS:2 [Rhizophagus irregularis]|nr:750_t:CDS:2 [Rhizophagus irregularis]
MSPRIVVLISGNGSNLQAIIDAINSKTLNGQIVLVVSNKDSAYGLTRATQAEIPTLIFPLKPYKDLGKTRIEYDIDLAKKIKEYNPNLIVLAGADSIKRAYEAFKKGEITKTGVMVHKVIPDVDKGEPLLIEEVSIFETDSLNDLETRIHTVEHRLIVQCVKKILDELNH